MALTKSVLDARMRRAKTRALQARKLDREERGLDPEQDDQYGDDQPELDPLQYPD